MKIGRISISSLMVALFVVCLPSLQSCKKYEDGPDFSLRTRGSRVANTWRIDNYKINGDDFTSLVSSYTETFTQKGAYSYDWGFSHGSGSWEFANKDADIKLNGSDDQSSRTLHILKLEENSLWYYYMQGNDKHELHLIAK